MAQTRRSGGIKWGAVALGWIVAVVAGVVFSFLLRLVVGLVIEFPLDPSELTAAVVVTSLLSGFLAYLVGGFTAGRSARTSGGINGAMTAVFGVIVGIVVSIVLLIFGAIFAGAVAVPPVNFGMAGGALLAGLILFVVNLVGGYLGGLLGEPSR